MKGLARTTLIGIMMLGFLGVNVACQTASTKKAKPTVSAVKPQPKAADVKGDASAVETGEPTTFCSVIMKPTELLYNLLGTFRTEDRSYTIKFIQKGDKFALWTSEDGWVSGQITRRHISFNSMNVWVGRDGNVYKQGEGDDDSIRLIKVQ